MATLRTRVKTLRYGMLVAVLVCLAGLTVLSGLGLAAMRGDVNDDKVVNVFDALLTLQYAVNLIEHTPENNVKYLAAADVAPLDAATQMPKGNSIVDVFDALSLLRHAVNLDPWNAGAGILGLVSDSAGVPLPGVTITSGSVTAVSGTDGHYTLTVSPGDNLKVSAAKSGFVETFDVVTAVAGQNTTVDFMLRVVGSSATFEHMIGTPVLAKDSRGAEVNLPASSIVDSSGTLVHTATVEITTGLPGDYYYTDNFPGLFIGNQGGITKPIESFGFVTVNITSGGAKCNLGSGKTADIAIPVTTSADPGTPTIELWSLDETTGTWQYEGLATRDNSKMPIVYRATVTHFSTYNLDRPIQAAMPFTVTVKDGETLVAGAAVVVTSTGTGGAVWEGRGITGADGTYRFAEIPQGSIQVKATFGQLKGSGYMYQVNNNEATMTVTLIRLVSKEVMFYRMVGTVKTPVAGAQIQAFAEGQAGGQPFFGTTGADGKIIIELPSGMQYYMVSANATIDTVVYSGNVNVQSFSAIPSEVELKPNNTPPAT